MYKFRYISAKAVPSRSDNDDGDGEDALPYFFHKALREPLMTPEEEFARAAQIAAAEIEAWRLILSSRHGEDVLVLMAGIAEQEIADIVINIATGVRGDCRSRRTAKEIRYLDNERVALEAATTWVAAVGDTRLSDKVVKFLTVATEEKAVFVRRNLRLVVSVAKKFGWSKIPLMDLVQEGNVGLMKAVERFDHRRGWKFATYATWWIRHTIQRWIEDKGRIVRIPVHIHQSNFRVRRHVEHERVKSKTGKAPTKDELISAGFSAKQVERALGLQVETISMETPSAPGSDLTLADAIADTSQSAEERCVNATLHEELRRIVSELPDRDRLVIERRFGLCREGEAQTLREVGDTLGVSRERVRQVEALALGKLRRAMAGAVGR